MRHGTASGHASVRIIAGSRKGHTISAPRGSDTRPTADRVRESVFNIVAPWVDGSQVLDLYAGSGAMGLEALSRGAERAVFVESDREACRTIERNLDKLRLRGEVRCGDVLVALANERRSYDLILVDPPYEDRDHQALARYLPRLLAENGLVVFETAAKVEPELPLTKRTSRRYGAARITLFEP
jgi:16S rRNA (guanine966-N2)-methyltransferase